MSSRLSNCPLCGYDTDLATTTVVGCHVLRCCKNCTFCWSEENGSGHHSSAEYTLYGNEYLKNRPIEDFKYWIKLTCFRRKEFARIHAANPDGRPLLLDVGAGTGRFVAHCRNKGIDAFGVEPSSILRDYAASRFGISLFPSLEELSEQHGSLKFDVVTSHDVIEHLSAFDLALHLGQLRNVLRRGGYLFGNTPNIASLNIAANPIRDPVVSPPHHCLYFSPKSLRRCLEMNGFEEVETTTAGLSAFFIPRTQNTLLSKLMTMTQKAIFGMLWPIVREIQPDRGYQIFFAYQKK